ncbi:hypothetical protein D3C73_1290700 [compost metagenome]
MSTWPATTGFVGGRARAQQLAVRLVAAELLQAPWALHRCHRLDRRDEGGCQPQGQDQAAEFAFERFKSVDEKCPDEAENGKHRKRDDHLLGAVMQDVFEEVTVASDEILRHRIIEQRGQVHVQ